MGYELIDYKNKGFQTSDSFIQLALYYINEELKDKKYIITSKNSLQKYNEDVLNGSMAGWFAFLWDDYIISSNDEQIMTQALQVTKSSIATRGEFISVNELQAIPTKDLHFKNFFHKPFPTSELIKIIDALSQMLEGTWQYDNYNMEINYKY
jgi:hypothetical protein